MSKKNHAPGPVPKGNVPQSGPDAAPQPGNQDVDKLDQDGTGSQEADPKRGIGNYVGTGEHAQQQYNQNRD